MSIKVAAAGLSRRETLHAAIYFLTRSRSWVVRKHIFPSLMTLSRPSNLTMLSSQRLNLHSCCHDMIIIEPPRTINLLVQLVAQVTPNWSKAPAEYSCCAYLKEVLFDDFAWSRALKAAHQTWTAETNVFGRLHGTSAGMQMIGVELN